MFLSEDINHTIIALNCKHKNPKNSIYIVVLLFFLIVVISLPFITVAIDSQARGIVRSQRENVKITPIVQGEVIHVNMKDNQVVEKGDLLVEIEPSTVISNQFTKEKKLATTCKQLEDITRLCNSTLGLYHSSMFQNEKKYFDKKLEELELYRKQRRENLEQSNKAFEEGIISKEELQKSKNQMEIVNKEFELFKRETQAKWHTKKVSLEEKIQTLNGEIAELKLKKKDFRIRAPISGTIVKYSGVKEGAFINGNENLAEIAPDDQIIAECYVRPKDIGFVFVGQDVKLQMDAFNFNQWGLLPGVVYQIDRNLTFENEQNYIKVRCKLLSRELFLKNGFKVKIKKGMTCTARISLVKRSLWNLLLDELDDWFHPKLLSS